MAETRRRIQAHAIRLFTERGYDATTVSDVARAAGVPVTTVYRLFPTKEDLVLHDRSDALLAARVVARPADECPVLRIGRTLVEAARLQDALTWFHRTEAVDSESITDAAERAAELEKTLEDGQ